MPKINVIGTPTPVGSSITKVEVKYKGNIVTEVPAGEKFDVYAWGIGKNTTDIAWEVLFTMIDGDRNIACYNPTDAYTKTYETAGLLPVKITSNSVGGKEPIMPNKDITLRIKLWGNDHRGMALPPISEW